MAGMPAAGHVNPSLPLVRELTGRGVRVTYYTASEFREPVERAGAEFRPYPPGSISPQDIAEATRSGSSVRVVIRLLTATESLLPFLLAELRADRPDAVAFDSNAIWGRMAAATLDLPMISFMTTFMVGTAELKALNAHETAIAMRAAVPDLLRAVTVKRRVVREFGKDVFPPQPTLPIRGDVTIFPIPRWLQPANKLIDQRCHFVGPTVDPGTRNGHLDPELAAHLEGPEPVVLVSLGTLHAGSDDFFRTCFEVLGDVPARVVLTVGGHTDHARLGRAPANTLVRTSVPQLEVLRRTAVFVTHGGMNSALEALHYGVPLVVVPQQVEQLLIGQAVAGQGAGLVLRHNLSHRPVPGSELRDAVDRALTDASLRTSARAVAETLTQGGGAAAGADAVQGLLVGVR
ncbi:macrolide family glycosyltransferase [Pseudonocardia acaciae]|uniref:macrolide family glycosyltransferase n=1 Tax=Pseudonocardia acaciae TaxID=551276 RepID=UPI0006865AF0|nr:macrolide family glycosyltransferase [Pseudonocardia acaciae]